MGPVLDASGSPAKPLDVDEVGRRPPSVKLLVIVILSTLSATGAVFTIGSKWGGSANADTAARAALSSEIAAVRTGLASNVAALEAMSLRLATVEVTKTTLVPAVDRLSVQTEKLAEAVAILRENLAAQTVEIRNLKDAVGDLKAKVK